MRNPKRLFASLFTTATVATGLLLAVPAQPAAAADPSTNWTPATISDIGDQHSFTQLDGGVTVGGCGTATRVSRSFSTTGTITQSFSQNIGGMVRSMCPWNSATGADGTVYMVETTPTGSSTNVLAFKNAQLKWTYPVPCGAQVSSLVVGFEGNIYFVADGVTSPCGTAGSHLMGVAPIAPSGTTTPTKVLDVPLAGLGGAVHAGGLAVYDKGFVIRADTGGSNSQAVLHYLSRRGFVRSSQMFNAFSQRSERFDTSMVGRGFIATKADASQSFGCLSPNEAAGSIRAVDPVGSGWDTRVAACTYLYELRPTPNNGVVVHWGVQKTQGGPIIDELVAYSYQGTRLWTTTYPALDSAMPAATTAFAVDLGGNVAIQRSVVVGKTINGTYYKFPQVHFSLRNGSTGVEYIDERTRLNGLTSTSAGPSYQAIDQQVRIAHNAAYVTARKCTNITNCPASSAKVYSFPISGLEIDYPRGAILQSSQLPWKSLWVGGDSFTSGLSIEPYSDTSGCGRSQAAYAELLDGNPATGLKLAPSSFVACASATTQDMIDGRNGESSQLNSLNLNTDVGIFSVSGNDVGFTDFAKACTLGNCSGTKHDEAVTRVEEELPAKLDGLFAAMRWTDAAHTIPRIDPNKIRMLVLGYPMLVPESAGCPYFWDGDWWAARDVIFRINRQLYLAAERAGAPFEYVALDQPLTSEFTGHELCTNDSYFNDVDWPPENEGYSFHPNSKGADTYRREIEKYLLAS